MRKIINITVVDLQQSVSVSEATAFSHPSRHYISNDVTLMPLLHAQMEAVCLYLFSLENAETRADCWLGDWARRNAVNQSQITITQAANFLTRKTC